jgi:hypothetical protein
MNPIPPPLPSTRPARDRQPHRLSTRLTASLLLLLGFGFTASALLGDPPEAMPAAAALPVAAPAGTTTYDGPSTAEVAEVDVAVHNWAWETSSQGRPARVYDTEELWLAR